MGKIDEGIAIVNGQFSLISEAKIPLTDRGFLFGHGVFETLLVNNGAIIAFEKHLERLKQSCTRSFIKPPDETLLKKLALESIQENIKLTKSVPSKMALRIIVTGGNSLNLPIQKDNEKLPDSNLILICRNILGPSQVQYLEGINLKSVLDIRPKELLDIKSCNYLFNIMALEEAHSQNYEDVLFYDHKGNFTECSTANFIWFDENHSVYSAPFKNNCLAGTTLTMLVEALSKTKINFQWKSLKKSRLNHISGCAMLSSTRLILPVKKIDETSFHIEGHFSFFKELNEILYHEAERKMCP